MGYLYFKALHIIFVVTWFSGVFYLGRLLVYNREAEDRPQMEKEILQRQFSIMISRLLYGICWPSTLLTWGFGLWLFAQFQPIPIWLWIKLGLVFLLTIYQISLHRIGFKQKAGLYKLSSQTLRIWNEVPTVFLVAIIMLVVVRQSISLVYGLAGLIGFILVLMGAIKIYQKTRDSDS